MTARRCVSCMAALADQRFCPRCGFDNSKEPDTPFVLKPNTILHGKYLVGKVLGQGGFGITYIGFDLTLETKVAIKEYFPASQASRNNNNSDALYWHNTQMSQTQWQTGCESFLKEARKMAKVSAVPEIVRVLETFNENNTAYIVMEYVEGVTLKTRLENHGPMPYNDCVKLLLPLIRALDGVHRQGMIHRDISPDNIMLQPDGQLRLLDLGAAKDLTAQNSAMSMKVAKNGFSPLEQYGANGEVGPWTDVYAMCSTIYYCVTGKMVPDAPDRLDRDSLNLNYAPVPLTEEQKAVLRAGLAVQKRDRIQNMSELAARMEASLPRTAPAPGPVPGPGPGPVPGPKKNSFVEFLTQNKAAAVATVLLVVIAVAMTVTALYNGSRVGYYKDRYDTEYSKRSNAERELSKVKTERDSLQAMVDAGLYGYSEDEMEEVKEKLDTAQSQLDSLYDITEWHTGTYGYASENYHTDGGVMMLRVSDGTGKIRVYYGINGTVRFDTSDDGFECKWGDAFDKDGWVDLFVTPKETGVFSIQMTNDENSDAFDILVIVAE